MTDYILLLNYSKLFFRFAIITNLVFFKVRICLFKKSKFIQLKKHILKSLVLVLFQLIFTLHLWMSPVHSRHSILASFLRFRLLVFHRSPIFTYFPPLCLLCCFSFPGIREESYLHPQYSWNYLCSLGKAKWVAAWHLCLFLVD